MAMFYFKEFGVYNPTIFLEGERNWMLTYIISHACIQNTGEYHRVIKSELK